MMNEPINMVQLVKELHSRPRGKACIVLTHEYEGQKGWAAELASQTDSGHIDLLELFADEKTLSDNICSFSVSVLFGFLKDVTSKSKHSSFIIPNSSLKNAPVLIVSGIEFLKATWAGQPDNINEFASRVKTWNLTPGLLFVLQYDKTLATYDFGRRYHYTFLVDQKETLAL